MTSFKINFFFSTLMTSLTVRLPGSVPPMVNLGNTCYANSLLQALARL